MRRSLEVLALGAALALVTAFLVSFGANLRNGLASGPGTRALPAIERAEPDVEPPRERAPRVEILNAARRAGLARSAMDRLRAAGFDVVYYGNADALMDSSLVLSRVEDDDAARAVAKELGITRVERRVDASLLLEVTVLLGRDRPAVDAGRSRSP